MFAEIRGLSFRYKNSSVDNVKDFNLEMNQGEVTCILGESGSGKSTVLRLLAGLEFPLNGQMQINGKILFNEDKFVLPEKRGIGMVFQDYALFPHMTVEENIRFGLTNLSKQEKTERIREMLELVHLEDYAKRYPYELSGGQQQRVAIARAVAPKPSILLLDEPFSNLDAHLRQSIREELNGILKDTGMTSIFVTHDREDAKSIADQVVILDKGETIGKGKAIII
ncbi:ABC transporter ATP-binding protein [Desulfosporosinus nitroreducens]|uniref:ABC transporter ATP-binding protein n=1 Tax=Desulfosporosinus nitroreducens TaxID=2018668 RepID=UPI00207CFDF9|nr:ABC transporter ATP-binding protein [Desulfosporosinus nitroreducens]MCO1604354.1 ABC transporter ATP-binding protein [Desulfosporosinus nitroreducens]